MSDAKKISTLVDLDAPRFDLSFQESLLHIAFNDEAFAVEMFRHLSDETGNLPDIFLSGSLQVIYKCFYDCYNSTKIMPSEGQMFQYLNEKYDRQKADNFKRHITKVASMELSDENYYRQKLSAFVIAVKLRVGLRNASTEYQKGPLNVLPTLYDILKEVEDVGFEKDSIVNPVDIFSYLSNEKRRFETVPVGIPQIDDALLGGPAKGGLHVLLAIVNSGKTTFLTGVAGVGAILAGKKVLHVNLDGTDVEPIIKYYSTMTGIAVEKLYAGENALNEQDRFKIEAAKKKMDGKLLIKNPTDKSYKIEHLLDECLAIKRSFDYDVLIIDYIGVTSTIERTADLRQTNIITHRKARVFAKKLNVVLWTSVQATRDAQKKFQDQLKDASGKYILRSTDVAESDEIGRLAESIISLNRDQEEEATGKARLFLEKSRVGKKHTLIGLETDYSTNRINTGVYYDPNEKIDSKDFLSDEISPERAKMLEAKDRENLIKSFDKSMNLLAQKDSAIEIKKRELEIAKDETELSHGKTTLIRLKAERIMLLSELSAKAKLIQPGISKEKYDKIKESVADLEKNSSPETKAEKMAIICAKKELIIAKFAIGIIDPV